MKEMPLLSWVKNVSLTKKLYFVVGIMAALIGVELFALSFTIHTLSATRALVGGEGLWSKAEKDAIFSLQEYGYTNDEDDYQHFLTELAVPFGDHKARLALSKTPPDINGAAQGFMEGRIYKDDIDGVIKLLTRFNSNVYLQRAVIYWTRGDSMISVLQNLGATLHTQIQSGKATDEEINLTSAEIQNLNVEITKVEDNFSFTLGEGSRWMEHLILKLLFLIALTVECTGLFLTVSVSRAIAKGINGIVRIARKVSTGDFSKRATVFSKDEIGFLAESFNQMVGDLEQKTIREKRSEYALRSQKELYETLLTSQSEMGEGVIISENDSIVYVNQATCKICGYSLEEIMRLPSFIKLFPQYEPFPKVESEGENETEKKAQHSGETKIQRKDGKSIDVEFTTHYLQRARLIQSVTIFRDVTEKNKLEEQFREEKENAVRAELSKKVSERFLATMSHEIRTPMNAIIGFTRIILKTELTPEQEKYLSAIKISGDNLLVIINDILDFSRIKEGKMPIEEKNFNLSEVLSICVEQMLPKAIEKGITLSSNIDDTVPDQLAGDSNRLSQMLLNLLSNAVKFTNQGGIEVKVEKLSENEGRVELKFSVRDTGVGIKEDKLASIFDEFTQANDNTARLYGGTGLGLAIVRQLAELQGGNVWVESKFGEGSCFYFTITYKKTVRQKIKTLISMSDNGKAKLVDGIKVLVVEDNEMNVLLAQKVLQDWGWTSEIAADGNIAIDKIKQNEYDIVLMDIELPEMNGYEATAFIRKNLQPPKSSVPIIAMTAHALQTEEAKCIKAGMNGYVSKPISEKLLYAQVLLVLNKG